MFNNDYYQQYQVQYELYKDLLSKQLMQFELPFAKPGCHTQLDDQEIVSFASNDYLSLLHHPEVNQAAIDAINQYGTGAGSSMIGSGSLKIHAQLAEELADFLGKEMVLLFPTGYSAMLAFCAANIMNGAMVFSDASNHRCIIDGLLLGVGSTPDREQQVQYLQHNSVGYLQKYYQDHCLDWPASIYKLLMIEGVYSMDGDVSDMGAYAKFCSNSNIMVGIDDAHGVGVLGDHGRGTASHYKTTDQVDFILGTFSKTFACTGGFIAGSKTALEYLRLVCGSYMYSASLVPANTMVALKVLNMIRNDDSMREKLWENVKYLKQLISNNDFDMGNSDSAIVPVYIRDTEKTLGIARDLLKSGFYVIGVAAPAVLPGQELIRISVNAGHSKSEIDKLVECLVKLTKEASG